MLANQEREFFAAFGEEQFGIAQAANAVRGIENDGGRNDRAEQRSAATSSTPATSVAPAAQARFSKLSVQRSFFSSRNFAVEGETPSALEFFDLDAD